MNRQCYVNEVNGWVDYGAVSFAEAAILEAKEWSKDVVTVRIRDEAEPEIVHTLTVRRQVVYSIEGLRGGDGARTKGGLKKRERKQAAR